MDIDKDGDLDLLVGEKYESVHYYQRQADGSLKEQPILIKLEKPDPNLAYMSISPSVADWNGDGAFDIIIGSDVYKSGIPWPLRLYMNKGSATSPSFSTYDTLRDKSGTIISASCARTAVGDLDLDGKNDLVVGNQRCVVMWYRNTGTNSKPVFESIKLIPNEKYGIAESPDFEQMAGFGYATPRMYDWNKDKKPDLLLSGYSSGKILIYLNQAATSIETTVEHETVGAASKLAVRQNEAKIKITCTTYRSSFVTISVIDARGRNVAEPHCGYKAAGTFTELVNCATLVQGIYVIRVTTGQSSMNIKTVFTR